MGYGVYPTTLFQIGENGVSCFSFFKPCSVINIAYLSSFYKPVFYVVMHSNNTIGPLWRIYSKTVIAFELVRDFVIWKIVPCN